MFLLAGSAGTGKSTLISHILCDPQFQKKKIVFSATTNKAVSILQSMANMAPEYGATCGFFPIDSEVLNYLRLTGRDEARVALVEAYAKAQGMWRDSAAPDPQFTDTLSLNLGDVVPSLAGPKRPQDRVSLPDVAASFAATLQDSTARTTPKSVPVAGTDYQLTDGDVVIAAITSCTNTSNPSVLVAAGLLAKAFIS